MDGDNDSFREKKSEKEIVIDEVINELHKYPKHLNLDELGDYDLDTNDLIKIFSEVGASLETVTMKRWPDRAPRTLLGSILSEKIRQVTIDDASAEVVSLIIEKCPNLETLETIIRPVHVAPLTTLKKLTKLYHTDVRGVEPDIFSKMLEEEKLSKAITKSFFNIPLEHLVINQATIEMLDAFDNCMNLKTVEIRSKIDDIALSYIPDRTEELIIFSDEEMYDKMEQKDLAKTISELNIKKFTFSTDFIDTNAWCQVLPPYGQVKDITFESGFPILLKEDFLEVVKSGERLAGNLSIQEDSGIKTYQIMRKLCDTIKSGNLKYIEIAEADLSDVPDQLKIRIAAMFGEACSEGKLQVFKGLDKVFTEANGMLSYYKLFLKNLKTSSVSFPMDNINEGKTLSEVMQRRSMIMNETYAKIKKLPKAGPFRKEHEGALI